jgi:glutathione S-transferase
MRLYDNPISGNCYKVRLLLAHLGVDYERVTVDVIDRSNPRDELATLSPTRRIPTLVLDDGRPLAESNAIIWYLGEGTRFVPGDRYDRGKALQWLFFEQYEHEPSIAVARFLMTYYGKPEVYESQREQLTKRGLKALAALEAGLHGRDWLAGDSMTVADIALYAYTHNAHEGGFVLDEYPAIREWLGRVAAQPGHVAIDS